MLIFTLKKLGQSLTTLLLLLCSTFFLLRLAPGGPFDGDQVWPTEVQAAIDAKYGLDQPLWIQFKTWLFDLLQGDLRESFFYVGTPVIDLIREAYPPSLELGFYALVLSVVLGIALGTLAAAKRGSFLDSSAMFLAVSGMTLPSYLLATLLVLIFANFLGWFPPALWEGNASKVLPVITLAVRPISIVARMTRTTLLEVLHSDYIRTAYAKGASDRTIFFKHALRNALIPVVTFLGPITASLITGSYVVETVFQVPGLGQYFVSSVLNRDYPTVLGMALVFGVTLLLCNLIVDLLYRVIDPRIRIDREIR